MQNSQECYRLECIYRNYCSMSRQKMLVDQHSAYRHRYNQSSSQSRGLSMSVESHPPPSSTSFTLTPQVNMYVHDTRFNMYKYLSIIFWNIKYKAIFSYVKDVCYICYEYQYTKMYKLYKIHIQCKAK